MALDNGLTPEEQRFFETGSLPDPTPQSGTPPIDPVALHGLGTAAQPAATPTVPQVPAVPVAVTPPVEAPQQLDVAEILRRNLADAQQRVAELEHTQRQAQQQSQPTDPGPDPATDPLGALMHQLQTVQAKITELQSHQTQQTQQSAQMTAFQSFQSNVQALRNQFAASTPDFDAAYAHVRNARIADLQAYGMTQQKINETLFREEVALAESAINQGRNPAAVVYDMAKRHGYSPTAVPNAQPQAPAAKLDAIAAAQSAARNIQSQPNSDPEVTLEGLKAASEADLNRMVMDPRLWGKIAGSTEYPL